MPDYIWHYDVEGAACAGTANHKLFERGALVTPIEVFIKSGDTCVSQAPNAAYKYYARGTEVPLASFATVTEMVDP